MDRAGAITTDVIRSASSDIDAVRTKDDQHRQLLTLLRQAVPATAIALILPRANGDLHVIDTGSVHHGPVQISRPLIRRVLARGDAVVSRDTLMSPPFGADEASVSGLRSLICLPVFWRQTVLGALYLVATEPAAFDDDHLQLATAFARVAAIALENVRWVSAVEGPHTHGPFDGTLVGESAPMKTVCEQLGRVARADTSVLITGETGTGKELAARAIHRHSKRHRRPFVAINCAALTETLLESELFGHERGAFTGAVAQKKGRVELAEGGTLFLDEIGELPPTMQAKLLRVLQEREFERVGGTRSIKVDVRLVSATNRSLAKEVRARRFREDLYHRLNVVTVELPPLRDRASDIPLLARQFLSRSAAKTGRAVTDISPAAFACLNAYKWPGNVRELENVIERAIVLGSTAEIVLDDLPEVVRDVALAPAETEEETFRSTLVGTKKRAIVEAFRACGGSYVETARILHIHPNYLHRLVRRLGLRETLTALRSRPISESRTRRNRLAILRRR